MVRDLLRVRLREELGGTYSPGVNSFTYALPEERYRVLMSFLTAPERMHELDKELRKVLDTVRIGGASQAELARAATIQRRQLETALEDNSYWMRTIGLYDRLGIPLDEISTPYSGAVVTPQSIADAARRYLPDDLYIHITAMPKDSTSYPKPAVGSEHSAHHSGQLSPAPSGYR